MVLRWYAYSNHRRCRQCEDAKKLLEAEGDVAYMFCWHCGSQILEGGKFCPQCGKEVASPPQVSSNPPGSATDAGNSAHEAVSNIQIYAVIAKAVHSAIEYLVKPFRPISSTPKHDPQFVEQYFFKNFFAYADKFTELCCEGLANTFRQYSLRPEVRGTPSVTLARSIRQGVFANLDKILHEYASIMAEIGIALQNSNIIRTAVTGAVVGRVLTGYGSNTGTYLGAALGAATEASRRVQLEQSARDAAFAKIINYLEAIKHVPKTLLDYGNTMCFGGDVDLALQQKVLGVIEKPISEDIQFCVSVARQLRSEADRRKTEEQQQFWLTLGRTVLLGIFVLIFVVVLLASWFGSSNKSSYSSGSPYSQSIPTPSVSRPDALPGTYADSGLEASDSSHPKRYKILGKTFVQGNAVNLRAAPNGQSRIIGQVNKGEELSVVGFNTDKTWACVLIPTNEDYVGWASVQFLGSSPPATHEEEPTFGSARAARTETGGSTEQNDKGVDISGTEEIIRTYYKYLERKDAAAIYDLLSEDQARLWGSVEAFERHAESTSKMFNSKTPEPTGYSIYPEVIAGQPISIEKIDVEHLNARYKPYIVYVTTFRSMVGPDNSFTISCEGTIVLRPTEGKWKIDHSSISVRKVQERTVSPEPGTPKDEKIEQE